MSVTSAPVVECRICGNRMSVPADFDMRTGRCSRCGIPFNPIEDLDVRPALSSVSSASRTPVPKLALREALRGGVIGALWGLAGGIVAGAALAIVFILASLALGARDAGLGTFGLDIGFLVGGFLVATWMATRELDLQAFGGGVVGAVYGLAAALLHVIIERNFLNLPEASVPVAVVVGLIAGIVFGGAIGYLNED